MADEFIKKDTAINEAICAVYWALNQHGNVNGQVIIDRFNAIPSADVVEVRHGKWEEGLCYDYYSKGVLESKCSICGSWNLFDSDGYNCESNFCPHCGADMRKDGGR